MTNEYIAGFFDGEGSIFVSKNKVRLSISQANLKVLEDIQQYLGFGGIHTDKQRNLKWKQSWAFYTRNRGEAHKMLLLIIDHLIVKKEKCLLAIKVIETANHEADNRKRMLFKAYDLVVRNRSYREAERQTGVSRQSICRYMKRQGPLTDSNKPTQLQ